MGNETIKKGLFFIITALFGVIPISILATNQLPKSIESVYAQKSIPYSCASWHFGMNDETQTANTKKVESLGALSDNKFYRKDNITIVKPMISNCYFDTTNSAMRLGRSGSNTGFIMFTTQETIIGLTVYVYTPTSTNITVNKIKQKSTKQGGSVTYENQGQRDYLPYYFELEQTSSITIMGSGIYLGDITFRII